MAQLTYYIFEGMLVGFAGGSHVYLTRIGSGGGYGGHSPDAGIANNPYATALPPKGGKHSPAHTHGGPLPIGRYTIHRSTVRQTLGRCCYLEPHERNLMYGRSGFYIHGRGIHGSDGCLVPGGRLAYLLDLIDRDGGGTLHVLETTEDARFA